MRTRRFFGWEWSAIGLSHFGLRRLPPSQAENYDLSVILPFYKKLEEFKRVLPQNAPYFQRNGIEVIVVMDEPSEEAGVVELLKSYPFINWRLIVNDAAHPWRNPAKAINVGIRHAQRSKVLVMSPESLLESDVVELLAEHVAAKPRSFATGIVRFENGKGYWITAGSICAPRRALEEVGGYDESYTEWGADDDDVRIRLKRAGYRGRQLLSARVFHTETKPRPNKVCSDSSRRILDDAMIGSHTAVNDDSWGRDFSRISFDYRRNIHAAELCRNYLQTFAGHAICGADSFKEKRSVVALIQCHHNPDINETLEHVGRFSDGIILLDDGSTDGTFEQATHPKLLIKAQKARSGFNDLENRNILLNIASFVPSDWLYFIDTDERFDERFETPHQAAERDADALMFQLIHLWDDPDQYRVDYPFSQEGRVLLFRMFRNLGRAQIRAPKKLHFRASPYTSRKVQACRVLLRHYGHLQAENRRRKFEFYTAQDLNKDQSSYRHFLDEKVQLGKVADLRLE